MLFTVDKSAYIERVWDFTQYNSNCYMYKTRLGAGTIAWVVELPEGALVTRYLLEFAGCSTKIAGSASRL